MTQDANVSDPQGAVLPPALLKRLPALTEELLKRVLKQSEIYGDQSDIYGDDRLVPIDDLHQSLQDNLTFMVRNLGRAGLHDLAALRRTGRRRAEQGAPLATVLSSLQVGFRFIWETLRYSSPPISTNSTRSSVVTSFSLPPPKRGSANVPSPTRDKCPGLPAAISRYRCDIGPSGML